ncbi:TetR/AcrR family transcriptional regulator [Arsenicibacter rosenii]|uniref:TetR family transcriptional regulator n=1 Tax=Arsenicibacter rosenii TaxID=1750698 RepID=A0A1S2V9M6_9BACT|nr:TetR/AcrR family transcriptional regulator [Arsenicibacter rosenii]OIN55444.1 TetR family transcriptional regulator [Arsenicibacter rosenii]
MLCSSKPTEDRIKEAAKEVFMEKGFDGTTTRDIAKVAGINSALMNYYFRSKEKLFHSIFTDMCGLFFEGMIQMFNSNIPLREKIEALIDHEYTMMRENPRISIFIMNELHRNPERLSQLIGPTKRIIEDSFQKQIDEAVAAGTIRNVNAQHVFMMIIANIQFPFISKPVLQLTWNMNEETFALFCDQHIKLIKESICSYLFEFQPAC